MIDDDTLDRALALLPSPLFRHMDIYPIARRLGVAGVTLWVDLDRRGWIVRSIVPIGPKRTGKFFWERTPGSPRSNTQHERQAPMSPTYLGKAVSDEYMQGLVEGYRDGQRLAEKPVEDGDQKIIDRLTEEHVITERGSVVLGYQDAQGKGVEE